MCEWFYPDHPETGVPREGIEPSYNHSGMLRSEVKAQLLNLLIRVEVDEDIANLSPPTADLPTAGLIKSGQQTGKTKSVVKIAKAID